MMMMMMKSDLGDARSGKKQLMLMKATSGMQIREK